MMNEIIDLIQGISICVLSFAFLYHILSSSLFLFLFSIVRTMQVVLVIECRRESGRDCAAAFALREFSLTVHSTPGP